MSGTTSVPSPVFGRTGVQTPAESDILTGVLADMSAALGGNLNTALSTPQGQLASSLAAIIGDAYNTFAFYCNQVDPAYASGRMQDAIARLYFLSRKPAIATTVTATCTGLPGVQIPAGATAQDTASNIYACVTGGTIGTSGSVSLSFVCLTTGPIPCPATTLSRIYRTIPGWDTISNPADGVIGQNAENRVAFEQRRQQSVAQNSIGTIPSIQGAVSSVPNVLDCYVTDNSTNSPETLDGVSLPPHSLYVCVSGGDPNAIATAIWSKKAPGCGYAGNTTVAVQDQSEGYQPPFPTYNVSFQTAAPLTLVVTVTLVNTSIVPSDAQAQIQAAILNAFVGGDGGPRARIGSTIYASRFYAPVATLGPWAQIISIGLGNSAAPAATFVGSISNGVLTVSSLLSGTVGLWQVVMGTDIPDGVEIIALGSGTGGTGTYTLNTTRSFSSQNMSSIASLSTTAVVGVAHVPTLSAANILVSLSS
jgi:Baseplate J-like protein